MAKQYVAIGTAGYVTSNANEDVHEKLILAQPQEGWNVRTPTTSIEFLPKTDCVVTINGYTSTVLGGSLRKIVIDDINGGAVTSFITVTPNVEYVLNMTF